jgi:hypothetical protein
MSSDPLTSAPGGGAAERQPAVWPWLLLPLVALALFFALRAMRDAPPAPAIDVPVEAGSGGESGSH